MSNEYQGPLNVNTSIVLSLGRWNDLSIEICAICSSGTWRKIIKNDYYQLYSNNDFHYGNSMLLMMLTTVTKTKILYSHLIVYFQPFSTVLLCRFVMYLWLQLLYSSVYILTIRWCSWYHSVIINILLSFTMMITIMINGKTLVAHYDTHRVRNINFIPNGKHEKIKWEEKNVESLSISTFVFFICFAASVSILNYVYMHRLTKRKKVDYFSNCVITHTRKCIDETVSRLLNFQCLRIDWL